MRIQNIKQKLKGFTIFDLFSLIYNRIILFWLLGIRSNVIFKIKAFLWNVKYGKNIKCYGSVFLNRGHLSSISIGDNCLLISGKRRGTACSIYSPVKFRTYKGGKIIIKDDVELSGTSITVRSTSCTIGSKTMIAPNCIIMDSDFHTVSPKYRRNPGFENDREIIIGENVWIGSRSTILKGVKIGDNSIVAAGSVVTKNIPSDQMWGGIPAKFISKL
ncbi:MAG: acyltransferase [Marinifilaceae bacterium]|jgi:acetyltransferase-like isoleucine patch superfamily enzyme|nr:acyltransferase [Marinifilaceae bacterium]